MSNYYRISDPSDVRDLSGQIAAWLAVGNPKAAAWAPQPPKPTDDAVWVGGEWVAPPQPMVPESVTPYQFRLWLLRHNVSLAQIDSMLEALPQETKDEARVAWEYGLEVRRYHPLIEQFGAALGLSPAQIDEAFREAAEF